MEPERDRLYITVDLLIMTVRSGQLLLLLSRRKRPPCEGMWALPGRFVGAEESAEEAAGKLLAEMLPVPDPFMEQVYTFSDVARDPRGRVVSMAYLISVPWPKLEPLLSEPGTILRSFHLTAEGERICLTDESGASVAEEELAFDHARIIRTGLMRLRGKIDYSEIGFRFLEDPDAFSLGELQSVFEAVLDSRLDTSNFRRFILSRYQRDGRLSEIRKEEKRGRGRPAVLYRLETGNHAENRREEK